MSSSNLGTRAVASSAGTPVMVMAPLSPPFPSVAVVVVSSAASPQAVRARLPTTRAAAVAERRRRRDGKIMDFS